jgi:HK97 family phage major capsid protein
MSRLIAVREEIARLSEEQITALKGHEGKEIPADELPTFLNRNDKLKELQDEFARLKNQELMGEFAGQLKGEFNTGNGIVHPNGTPKADAEQKADQRSIGERFVNDEGFKNWISHLAPNGRISEKTSLQSPSFEVKDLVTGASGATGNIFITSDQVAYPGLVQLPQRPLTMRQIVTNTTTASDTVEFVRALAETNNAATVAEATAAAGSSGTKPESAFTFERVSTTVKTIAHWMPATTRALADARQLRGLIDSFLRTGLEQELEDQMVSGDGTGENFTGLEATSGILTQAYDTGLLKTARKARTNLQVNGRVRPTAWLMDPADWESFDLLVDNETRYYFGGPLDRGTPRLWGIPVIESEAVTAGYAYLGDFRYLVLWDREQTAITVSNSHADFFIRNLVAILAEMRAAFGCLRPTAFIKVDLTP